MSKFVCIGDYEQETAKLLGEKEANFLNFGANDEITLKWNKEAFKSIYLRQRMLRQVPDITSETTILGQKVNIPIGVSPVGGHSVFYHEGECATAKGAANVGACFVLSSFATTPIEDIPRNTHNSLLWFMVCVFRNRQTTVENIKSAVTAGYKALVFTVDSPVFGNRHTVQSNALRLPPNIIFPLLPTSVTTKAEIRSIEQLSKHFSRPNDISNMEPNLSWSMIGWMKKLSGLPVVVKGIMTAEDAELAIQHGADAIMVSNHGGRQLDTVPATIMVLSAIVKAVKGRVEVYLDGGIRTGTDVLKALALGARAVFVGRPVIWGLVCKGSEGVADVLNILSEELKAAMKLTESEKLLFETMILSHAKHNNYQTLGDILIYYNISTFHDPMFNITNSQTGCATIEDIKEDLVVATERLCQL